MIKPKNSIDKYIKIIAKNIKRPLVCFDLETTSADANKTHVVQFAAIKIYPNGKYEELTFLCKPDSLIEPGATEVHGIANEHVENEPLFLEFADKIYTFLKDSDLSGFNSARFDIKIITRQLEAAGYKLEDYLHYDSYPIFVKQNRRRLQEAVEHYTGKSIENAHEAISDVKSTISVIACQLEKEQLTLHEVIAKYDKDAKIDETAKYIGKNDKGEQIWLIGKHANKRLTDLDTGFIQWIKNKDFPQQVKDILSKINK